MLRPRHLVTDGELQSLWEVFDANADGVLDATEMPLGRPSLRGATGDGLGPEAGARGG